MKRTASQWARRSTMSAAILVPLMLMPLASYGEDKYWVGGTSGWWDEISNWSPSGQPQTGDRAYLTQSDAIDRTVDYRNVLDPPPLLGYLRVDATGSGTITFFQTLSSLSANQERVGYNGNASFVQSGGTNATPQLDIGSLPGSWGTYNLSGGGTLSAGAETIGSSGTGTFNQSAGTNTMTSWLNVGQYAGSNGSYNLGGTGALSVGRDETIGRYGTGTFTQTGGTNTIAGLLNLGERSGGTGTYNQSAGTTTVTGMLNLGHVVGSTGTYNLTGTGALSAGSEYVGSGTGTFNQTGGTNQAGELQLGDWYGGTGTYNQSGGTTTITGQLRVGHYSDSTGTYNLTDAGALTAGSEYIGGSAGQSGTGTFAQTGGTNTITGKLNVGNNSGSTGTYNLSGTAALSAGSETIGNSGTGTFTQTGGTNTTDTLTIKADPAGSGVYNLGGGTLNATTIVNNDRFNYSDGILNGNFSNSTGATFTLSGAGTRTVNGDVTNWGTVKVTGATQGTTAVFTGMFVNNGVLDSDPARLEFLGDLIIGPGGSIYASPGDQYVLYQDLFISSSSAADFITAGVDLVFIGPGTHLLSFNNLALTANALSLEGGATLDFDGSGSLQASMLSGLIFDPDGTVANISAPAGFTVCYDPSQNPGLSGTYQLSGGGTLNPEGAVVPLPAGVWLGLLGLIVAARRLKASGESLSRSTAV